MSGGAIGTTIGLLLGIGVISRIWLHLKVPALAFLGWVWLASFVFFKVGITPALPASIVQMFMFVVTVALLAYASADNGRLNDVINELYALVGEARLRPLLVVLLLVGPAYVGIQAFIGEGGETAPPVFGRTIHPAPPSSMKFKGESINLITLENPYRALESSDKDAFDEHVAAGRVVYYQNCVFCHGDDLRGKGIFAHGLNPLPANFQDSGTIAQLQEGFLFWRISKGGPGLPDESGPWASSMPAWEKFLSVDQIWDVILFLYDFTGQKPRAREEGHH